MKIHCAVNVSYKQKQIVILEKLLIKVTRLSHK